MDHPLEKIRQAREDSQKSLQSLREHTQEKLKIVWGVYETRDRIEKEGTPAQKARLAQLKIDINHQLKPVFDKLMQQPEGILVADIPRLFATAAQAELTDMHPRLADFEARFFYWNLNK